MLSKFFIDRPIFAGVLSIVIIVAGLLTLRGLPVAQYPEIAPPTINVLATYPGASASVLSNTVAQLIEEQINGIEDMLYMSSTCSDNGQYSLTITFDVGTDIDTALVKVQNRVGQAEALLPEEVQRQGLVTKEQSTNILLFTALTSDKVEYDALYLGNYALLRIRDELMRIPGIGDVQVFGAAQYAMRVWLDPNKLDARGLTTNEVIDAIRDQNVQVAAGQIGQAPAPAKQNFQLSLNVKGRLDEVEEFENIVIRSLPGGRNLRLKDVARIELGSSSYDLSAQMDGKQCAAIGVFLQSGANALETGDKVRARMAELSHDFPAGVAYKIPFDTTTFVETSIHELVETLFIAVVLVILIILLFLRDWRATLIPAATIPVSLIGTFAVMASLGVSINMLSLFGLVLAIGVVVDDAIVVVENVVRIMDEEGLPRKEASIKAMEQVTSPVIATSLVLMVVFVPTAFLGGITGELYRQFALTIATATMFSMINALTLSPALSALLLRPTKRGGSEGWFARLWFRFYGGGERFYLGTVRAMIRHRMVSMLLFGLIAGASFWAINRLPGGFVPNEDLGWAIMAIQLPDAASQDRMLEVVDLVNERMAKIEGIESYVAIPGFSLLDNSTASNAATVWIVFDDWKDRKGPDMTGPALVGKIGAAISDIQEAMIFAITPPPIFGLGNSGGFQMQIKSKSGDIAELEQMSWAVAMAANQSGKLSNVFTTIRSGVPQLNVEVDREHAQMVDTRLPDIYQTLQTHFGSVYVNNINKFGRTYQVRVMADSPYRASPDDIRRLKVRNGQGEMVALDSLLEIEETVGPQLIPRYNQYASSAIMGETLPGFSSGEGLELMERIADETLPKHMTYEWTGMSYQEKSNQGNTLIFALAVLLVYLVLCAQYESWTLPITVILAVPLSLLGTAAGVWAQNFDVNVYTQIGIILLIALACKTAILISEFAKAERDAGVNLRDAAQEAARLRFRPILMTALTFVLGVFPLVIASGAGAASRQALGTAVCFGMISATVLLVVFVPVFFVVVQGGSEWVTNAARRWRGKPPI